MKRVAIILFLFAAIFGVSYVSYCNTDTSAVFIIDRISLEGNRQTRPSIILRELTFREGDRLDAAALSAGLDKSRQNLFNTSLFNVVRIDTSPSGTDPGRISITVHVIERWYIWPIPWLEFPDRNINAWLEDPLFSRLTYGVNLTFFNFRGRNETLTLLLHFGYNQKYGFTYRTPYINKKQTWGFGFGANAELNRTLEVANSDNENVYLEVPTGFLRQGYSGYAEAFHRPAFYLYHTLGLSYTHYIFADTLRSVEDYFAQDTSLRQSLIGLSYKIKYDRRDEKYYPLTGYYADVSLTGGFFTGSSEDIFAVKSSLKGFWRLGRRWYAASGITGRSSFPGDQPFFLREGIGFGRDYLRGYDQYIITGQHFLYSKNNIKFAILPQRVLNLDAIRSQKFAVIPYALYLNLFADFGYVWNSDLSQSAANPLTNEFLFGYGLGLDFTTYYDVVIGVGFSMNIQGTPGASIHFIAPI